MAGQTLDAKAVASKVEGDVRGVRILLDAMASLELLEKIGDKYRVPPQVVAVLTSNGAQSRLAMAQHQANCLRRWAHLAQTIRAGEPVDRHASIRGAAADQASFIEAMDNVGRTLAGPVVEKLKPLTFNHLLDIGGASGTYTIEFLKAVSGARATLFDLPEVIPHAKHRIAAAQLGERVNLVAGDFYHDPLPAGADFAWVSAIIHQNSLVQNEALYRNVYAALEPGGQIAIRDIVMDETRTQPVSGALFAVNMLAGTPQGGTYTFEEIKKGLEGAGFVDVTIWHKGEGMDSVVKARKRGVVG